MEALVGTGRHIHNPQGNDHQPDEAEQPDDGGHVFLTDAGDDEADNERNGEGK
jgi:hypothetical protein